MPTRKQRRRREKDFRHDVRVFEVDEEGNEVPLAELRSSEERAPAKAKQSQKQLRTAKGKPVRVPPKPSWERAIKRGGFMGLALLVAFFFLYKNVAAVGVGVLYAAAFIPLTYWIDRTAYRSYQKRVARQSAKKG